MAKRDANNKMATALALPAQTMPPAAAQMPASCVKLRPIHALFAEKYLEYFDVVKAAYAAGYGRWYPEDQVAAKGRSLLRRRDIAAYVTEHLNDALRGIGVEKGRVLKEVTRIAFFQPSKLYGANGKLLKPKDLDEDTAAAISSVKYDDWGNISEYKMVSKQAALDLLAKHLGLISEANAATNNFFGTGSAPVFNVNFVSVKR